MPVFSALHVVCVHRGEIGSIQSELVTTKELYVGVCKVKDELEHKVRDLRAENTRAKVQLQPYTVSITELFQFSSVRYTLKTKCSQRL